MEGNWISWEKITLKEALYLDEKTFTHCLYAFSDGVNCLYIGISHHLVTRLYQHLGIAAPTGERVLGHDEAVHLLTENYGIKEISTTVGFFWYLKYYWGIFPGIDIQKLGLAIMNNRPQCLEWGYYYVPIQRLYPDAKRSELDTLLALEEKKLIRQYRPLFNRQHNT